MRAARPAPATTLVPCPPSCPVPPRACRTGSAQLRCNTIIALGDLALRFPNLLEPYTGAWGWGMAGGGEPPRVQLPARERGHVPCSAWGRAVRRPTPACSKRTFTCFRPPPPPPAEYMYRALDDSDLAVRKNAVMVLTHLILNDMMKVGWVGGRMGGGFLPAEECAAVLIHGKTPARAC